MALLKLKIPSRMPLLVAKYYGRVYHVSNRQKLGKIEESTLDIAV
jgi:hypothetical protein